MIKMKSWSCLPQLTRFKFSFEKQYMRQDYLKDLPLFICFSCSFMKSRHSLSSWAHYSWNNILVGIPFQINSPSL